MAKRKTTFLPERKEGQLSILSVLLVAQKLDRDNLRWEALSAFLPGRASYVRYDFNFR